MPTPLQGVRIVSMAVNLPGPIAATRLAALGATVTKVEPPSGDPVRLIGEEADRALVSGQTVVVLDLKSTDGLARLHDLDAKLALFNALGQGVPEADNPNRPGQPASWNAQRQAYCFSGPLRDEQGLRCLPWAPPPLQ